MAAATNSFAFGTFRLYQGRDAYTLADADIKNYFEGLMSDYEGAYYGMYFAEIADYFVFSSQSHFTSAFQEKYDMTPKKYRDTHSNHVMPD